MKLSKILKKCKNDFFTENFKEIEVKGLTLDSRDVKNNFIFVALKGFNDDGENYIDSILDKLNLIILVRKNYRFEKENKNVVILKTKKILELAGEISSLLYPHSIKDKIAVTGTNGKTSISHYVSQISTKQKKSNCIFGTLGIIFNNKKVLNTKLTTNDLITNHKLLNKFSSKNCERVIFEASSIGLEQKRLHKIFFDKIAFSNFTQDHLDYHKTLKKYRYCKSLLLRENTHKRTIVIINADSKNSNYFKNIAKKKKMKILDYGKNGKFLKIIKLIKFNNSIDVKMKLKEDLFYVKFKCNAVFQVYNQICALILVFGNKISKKIIERNLKLSDPTGRLEKIYDSNDINIFIDYAHTPDALKNVLSTLDNKKRNLLLVFGCGGDRDSSKRPMMMKQAIKYCSKVFLTNDNPRNEDPKKIVKDTIKGLNQNKLKKVTVIYDRKKAILKAMSLLKPQDTLLVAGKGHEKYQILKNKRIYFNDKEIILNELEDNE